nr:GtrA family protein [uncultured Cohaesibacter sp.]
MMVVAKLMLDMRVRFLLAGGSAALLNWGIRFLFSQYLPYLLAVCLALVVGMIYGFIIYRYWAFVSQHRRPVFLEIRDFILVNIGGGLVTIIVAYALNWLLGGLPLPTVMIEGFAHATGIAAGAVVNYLGHKNITFDV